MRIPQDLKPLRQRELRHGHRRQGMKEHIAFPRGHPGPSTLLLLPRRTRDSAAIPTGKKRGFALVLRHQRQSLDTTPVPHFNIEYRHA